jgi:hypothetical protein
MTSLDTFARMLNARRFVRSAKPGYIAVETGDLVRLLQPQINRIAVDEAWYSATYPDVGDAVAAGTMASAAEHYSLWGYYEHRLPYPIAVDEQWYFARYPDVRQAIEAGDFRDAQAHFTEYGYREGRLPFEGFRLRLRDDSGAAVAPADC